MNPPGPIRRLAALFFAYAAVALAVYAPALHGAFVSDDVGYVLWNPWVHAINAENLLAILAPTGPAAAYTANYAPVHLLLHALDWQCFGADTLGHHVVNVVVHALASALVAALLARSGLSFAAAAAGGALFLVHPANVEAVAWIFQLKTVAALALACGALLAEPRRPLLATALFGLALLTKIQAAFALPVALVWIWLERPDSPRSRRVRFAWLGAWAALLALAWMPEFLAFERLGHADVSAAASAPERVRTMLALLGRYFAMAATSYGVSAFQQPMPPRSWLDPWCLIGALGAAALAGRALLALWRRDEEAAWWVWAAGGFLPVSQLLPFLYPMADRYLYYVLPGLIGGLGFAARRALSGRASAAPPSWQRFAVVLALGVLGAFAWRSVGRADVWRSEATLTLDAVRHYPNGLQGNLLRAQSAARRGDAEAAAEALRAASALGFDRFMDIERNPLYADVRSDPRFAAAVRDVAGRWIAVVERRANPTVPELSMLGQAHAVRGEWDLAAQYLERAVAGGGPGSDAAREQLAALRAQERAERAAHGAPAP